MYYGILDKLQCLLASVLCTARRSEPLSTQLPACVCKSIKPWIVDIYGGHRR